MLKPVSSNIGSYSGRPIYSGFSFQIEHNHSESLARTGRLYTPHGYLETPNFVFCATKAAMKNLSPHQMVEAGAGIILGNTYHLLLQPGPDLIEKMGGLHDFTGWRGPMLTDSGGFQIFSMKHGGNSNELNAKHNFKRSKTLLKIDEDGASFRSYIDGNIFSISPESSITIQKQLGADLIMQFDELTAITDNYDYTARSMERSCRWGDRSLKQLEKLGHGSQAMYGIVQGGIYRELRRQSIDYVLDRPFFGTAFGGCFGDTLDGFYEMLEYCATYFNPDRPHHLLGFGSIPNVFRCIKSGIDTFDCVSPTRIARHGWALMKGVPGNRINIRNACYATDPEPLDETSPLPYAKFSKAYIHHLFKSNELLGLQILSQYNVSVMACLMKEVRTAIKNDTLNALEKEWCVT